jgi:hypothetical protein
LTHFKLKVEGKPDRDLARLRNIAEVLEENCTREYAASLDGNESFREVSTYASFWDGLQADPKLSRLVERLLFVEQPLHREIALQTPLAGPSRSGRKPCPVIIDESDAELSSLPRALELGYSGTSHKNCKGVFKGIANRCLLGLRSRKTSEKLMMSGEDLSNVGPIALLQDIREGNGPARVTITNGRMSTRSTVDAPFGVGFQPDLDQFANQI